MKTSLVRPVSHSLTHHVSHLVLTTLAAMALGAALTLQAQFVTDDFTDGNDQGWSHYDPFVSLGMPVVEWRFTNGAYRLRTTTPTGMPENPGRGGSLRSENYTNFFTSVDIVNWDDTRPQSVGLLARIGTAGFLTTTGYAFTWDRGNPTNATAGTAGDVDVSALDGEVPRGLTLTGSDRIHLNPGSSYRFVFIGRGPNFEGRVYQLPDTNTPLIQVTCSDPTYPSGASGLVIYDNTGMSLCDATFDNFVSNDVEPPKLEFARLDFGEMAVAWPLVADSYTLQISGELPGSAWTSVPSGELATVGEQFYYYLPSTWASGPNQFFRLIRP